MKNHVGNNLRCDARPSSRISRKMIGKKAMFIVYVNHSPTSSFVYSQSPLVTVKREDLSEPIIKYKQAW